MHIIIESIPKFEAVIQIKLNDNKISFIKSEIYNIQNNNSTPQLFENLKELFDRDLNNEHYYNNTPNNLQEKYQYKLDIALLPGQTDNVASTVNSLIKEIYQYKLKQEFKDNFNISTIIRYYFNLDKELTDITKFLEEIKAHFAINDVIHNISLHLLKDNKEIYVDKIHNKIAVKIIDEQYSISSMTDEELIELNNELQLGLSLIDMQAIKAFYSAKTISRIELETFGQSWSEHCKHRIFSAEIDDIKDGLYKHYIRRATEEIRALKGTKDICYSVFTDNAGAIELNADYLITHKVETHNSPTALDPFGGAITGVLGVNRDCVGFGLGAKPIANTFCFCFAMPDSESHYYRKPNQQAPQLSANYIINGVIKGIEAGGNCSGIPTIHGTTYFDNSYLAKPLVFAGTIGLIPKKINNKDSWIKEPLEGDLIVILGGRTGRDGIHGAIFSSESIDEKSDITHVQIGDPITQKKMFDAILEARDLNLYNAITDNGAGGFSSSIGEMGEAGFDLDLSKAKLKSQAMQPFEIWVSESQERMTLAVNPINLSALEKICNKHDVEYQILGTFNKSGIGKITFQTEKGEKSIQLDMDFLHNGTPRYKLKTEKPESIIKVDKNPPQHLPLKEAIIKIMSQPNIASRAYIIEQYDHTVQGGSVIAPIHNGICNDASVVKPILSDKCGVVLSSALVPRYADDKFNKYVDSYHSAVAAIDIAFRNLIVVGANPEKIALLDNFCWSSPLDPKRLWQLKRTAEGCYDAAVTLQAPFISGKDSMFNDFKGFDKNGQAVMLSDIPTLLISSIGVVDDTAYCVTSDFKSEGDLIYILGCPDSESEMGGSEYYNMIGYHGGKIPSIFPETTMNNCKLFYELISLKIIQSASTIHLGGMITAINKAALAGNIGAVIDLEGVFEHSNESGFDVITALFNEFKSTILFTIKPQDKETIHQLLMKKRKEDKDYYFDSGYLSRIGYVGGDKIIIENNDDDSDYNNGINLTIDLNDLIVAYKKNYYKV